MPQIRGESKLNASRCKLLVTCFKQIHMLHTHTCTCLMRTLGYRNNLHSAIGVDVILFVCVTARMYGCRFWQFVHQLNILSQRSPQRNMIYVEISTHDLGTIGAGRGVGESGGSCLPLELENDDVIRSFRAK